MADVLWNTAWDVAWRRTVRYHSTYTNVSLFFWCCLFVYATDSIKTSGKGELCPCLVWLRALKEYGADADIPRHILCCDCPEVVMRMTLPMPCRFIPRKIAPGAHWIDSCVGPRSCCGRAGEGQYFVPLQNVDTLPNLLFRRYHDSFPSWKQRWRQADQSPPSFAGELGYFYCTSCAPGRVRMNTSSVRNSKWPAPHPTLNAFTPRTPASNGEGRERERKIRFEWEKMGEGMYFGGSCYAAGLRRLGVHSFHNRNIVRSWADCTVCVALFY